MAVESRQNVNEGQRIFLDLELKSDNGSVAIVSEYFYLPKKDSRLCSPVNYQWKKDAMVNVVLTGKITAGSH